MIKNCLYCKHRFHVENESRKYCSVSCYINYRKNHPEIFKKSQILKKCLNCKKSFYVNMFRQRACKYCSLSCFYIYRKEHPEIYNMTNCICKRCGIKFYRKPGYLKKHGIDGLYCSMVCRKGEPFSCKVCSKKFYRKPSQILKQGAGKFCSNTCKYIYQRSGIKCTKETYEERHLLRQSSQYKSWRMAAKKLCGNKCQKCGIEDKTVCECCSTVIHLHVHHIKSFAAFPKLRFDPKNASVLCSKCHIGFLK